MHSPAVYAVCGAALLAAVAAVPMKRDVVWETFTEEVVTTVAVTATVWVDATDAPTPNQVYAPPTTSAAPVATSPPAKAPYFPPAPSSSSSAYVAPAPAPAPTTSSSSSAQVQTPSSAPPPPPPPSSPAPAPAPAPESSSTSVYVPPSPPATTSSSAYVAPAPATTPTTTPVAPSSAAAPAPSASYVSPPAGGSSPNGKTYSGDITYYEPGLGSCGEYSTDSEPVVALAAGMMQKSYCGSSITISYQGSKQTAKIVDTCPGCSGASLDLSSTLFKAVAPNGDGRVHDVDWWFN